VRDAGQAFRASSADEVLAEHIEHGIALVPAVSRDGPQRQRECRQHQVLQAVDELVEAPPTASGEVSPVYSNS
jgi:hypothetical protein